MKNGEENGDVKHRRMPRALKKRLQKAAERSGARDEYEVISAGLDALAGLRHQTIERANAELVISVERLDNALRLQSVLLSEVVASLHELATISPAHIDAQLRSLTTLLSRVGGSR